ncbi:LysE family translocator [Maricaulis parjimensis]|uniref:LysE family translocator n=1 Tax=Maricaulis parjimensis TaxID=144023 RepID=UPI001939A55D|nr:LysE family translocator [Maricaulis parjimensis]
MLDWSLFPLFLAAGLALALSPGPDMAFTLATAASRGPRAGLGAVAGIITGGLIWTLAAAAGLAALVAASEHALTVVRYAGGAYLVWLAIRTVRALDAPMHAKSARDAWHGFRQGLMTNLLNPKIGLFFLALLPQFTNPDIGPVWLQMLSLGLIFFAMGTIILTIVALAAGAARDRLARSARSRRVLNGLAATAFGGLGLRLLFSGNTA